MKYFQLLKNFSLTGMREVSFMKRSDFKPTVAVLYQAVPPPIIDGVRKPMKPGGYSDSGADIAYNLKKCNVPVVTPILNPDPKKQLDWVFPDTEQGIQRALASGAHLLWANTVLFKGHPLEKIATNISIVGQPPLLMQYYDDKWIANEALRSRGLTIAPSCLISNERSSSSHALSLNELSLQQLKAQGLEFPLVVKPLRGRGSQGVSVVHNLDELKSQITMRLTESENIEGKSYSKYGLAFIIEQYMPGQEVTLTVMPPGTYTIKGQRENKGYWSLPVVKRFNHVNGIAPYNGVAAVVSNSALLDEHEIEDPRYTALQRECEKAARIIGAKAPIRIDCREGKDGKFYLFDVNMKPNMTGSGRPGREDQDSLTCIAARSKMIDWDYPRLIQNMYSQAWPANLMLKDLTEHEQDAHEEKAFHLIHQSR